MKQQLYNVVPVRLCIESLIVKIAFDRRKTPFLFNKSTVIFHF